VCHSRSRNCQIYQHFQSRFSKWLLLRSTWAEWTYVIILDWFKCLRWRQICNWHRGLPLSTSLLLSTRSSTLSSTRIKPKVEIFVSKWISYTVISTRVRNDAITIITRYQQREALPSGRSVLAEWWTGGTG